ncbi:MAG TPA: hypothetical protein VM344_06800 [Vitreimonas sp.]|nr:hypothetical protein [Vitreimonas sp.]
MELLLGVLFGWLLHAHLSRRGRAEVIDLTGVRPYDWKEQV